MSVGATTSTGGAGFEAAGPVPGADALLGELRAVEGSGPKWLSFLDSDSSTRKLAEKLLKDGKIDGADAKALVKDAKDYGKITSSEKQIFAGLLRDHADQITPDAKDALSRFFGLPVGRPQIAHDFPGQMKVIEGTSEYSLDDDKLIMTSEGTFTSSIDRDIYVAGYLPMKEGPMLGALGTKATESSILGEADDKLNAEKSPVERFDEAYKRATGREGKVAARYATEGKRDEADHWWGFCDRWAYAALDPEIATRVNEPILYQGVYFSTAELRGLASFLGRSDESGGLFDKTVSPLDLQKATTLFLEKNGPGFIGDVWLDKAHPGNPEVWNQPFDSVKQTVKELKGDELKKVLKDEFKLEGRAAEGKRIYYVETTGYYGVEASSDHYEGAAKHSEKNWKSFILTKPDGEAIDGKYAKGSDDPLEYIWRPRRTSNHGVEGDFLRAMLKTGFPAEKAKAFESALAALPAGPIAADKKADLIARFKGAAGGYPEAALAAKLEPFGLRVAEFR